MFEIRNMSNENSPSMNQEEDGEIQAVTSFDINDQNELDYEEEEHNNNNNNNKNDKSIKKQNQEESDGEIKSDIDEGEVESVKSKSDGEESKKSDEKPKEVQSEEEGEINDGEKVKKHLFQKYFVNIINAANAIGAEIVNFYIQV